MTGSVRCPNSAIAAPLAGAAEALEAATSPNPVATIIARAILHISFLLSDIPQLAFQRSARMYLPSVAIKRIEGALQTTCRLLRAGARDKADKWPTSTLIRLMRYAAV
jgi:hypothetical protein